MQHKLELFYLPTCPYCRKVFACLDELGIELPGHDISHDDVARARLLEIGGKTQVPCLFIDGKPLYESDDIVHYLKERVAPTA